jgi:hypothetical protein
MPNNYQTIWCHIPEDNNHHGVSSFSFNQRNSLMIFGFYKAGTNLSQYLYIHDDKAVCKQEFPLRINCSFDDYEAV